MCTRFVLMGWYHKGEFPGWKDSDTWTSREEVSSYPKPQQVQKRQRSWGKTAGSPGKGQRFSPAEWCGRSLGTGWLAGEGGRSSDLGKWQPLSGIVHHPGIVGGMRNKSCWALQSQGLPGSDSVNDLFTLGFCNTLWLRCFLVGSWEQTII